MTQWLIFVPVDARQAQPPCPPILRGLARVHSLSCFRTQVPGRASAFLIICEMNDLRKETGLFNIKMSTAAVRFTPELLLYHAR